VSAARQIFDENSLRQLKLRTDWLGTNVAAFITHYLNTWAPHKSSWHYEDGCIFKGAMDLYGATGLKPFLDFVLGDVSPRIGADGAISGYDPAEFNIDNINAGKVLFPLFESTGDQRFPRAIDRLWEQLTRHPRTQSGNYWHKQIYPNQVWLDGLYMAQPFQLAYATLRRKPDIAADTARQFSHVRATMRDANTGLYFHGWDESRTQKWANAETGCSPHVWGRAMGWFVMALIDCLDLEDILDNKDANNMSTMLRDALSALDRVRLPAGGGWLQVLDAEHDRNYQETSASLMIVYTMIKAGRLAELELPYIKQGVETLRSLIGERLSATELRGICGVAGLGGDPYRDGSVDYYLSEPVVANDPKGVGAFFMAVAEACRVRADRGIS
jgi:unsaturated rhamnogalacturonyl hydrolase